MARLDLGNYSIVARLFRSRREVAIFPTIKGGDCIPTPARRNPGSGTASRNIVKAVVAALLGNVQVIAPGYSPGQVFVKTRSTSGPRIHVLGTSRNVWYSPNGVTYHIPLIALCEAMCEPDKAGDLLDAWEDLLEYAGSPPVVNPDDPTLRVAVLRASDELYYWLRFKHLAPLTEHDLLANAEVDDGEPDFGYKPVNLAPCLTDLHILRNHRAGQSISSSSAEASTSTPAEDIETSFQGWQIHALLRGLKRGQNVLMVGPTGTGKTFCFQEAVRITNTPFEVIEGKEGLIDLDFLGAIVPTGSKREWVDGPLTRAFRRAGGYPLKVAGRKPRKVKKAADQMGLFGDDQVVEVESPDKATLVWLWVDEITLIPTRHLNILKTVLNPKAGRELALQGISPRATGPSGMYYTLEIPMTGERLACPVENLRVVAACNMGQQYAAYGLDPALERRFQYQLDFTYLDEQDEFELVMQRTGLDRKLAIVLVKVAVRTREMHANAELPAELDTASLLVWAGEVKAEVKGGMNCKQALLYTARITWLPRVAGRDHRGLLNEGTALGLEDVITDLHDSHLGGA